MFARHFATYLILHTYLQGIFATYLLIHTCWQGIFAAHEVYLLLVGQRHFFVLSVFFFCFHYSIYYIYYFSRAFICVDNFIIISIKVTHEFFAISFLRHFFSISSFHYSIYYFLSNFFIHPDSPR